MVRCWSLIFVSLICGGCMDIAVRDTGKAASAMTAPLHAGMSPDQVHTAIGTPDYAERVKNFWGFETGQVQEVYERGVSSEHFVIEPFVIGCGTQNGLVDRADSYKILVRYDGTPRVNHFEVVPSWTHGRDESTPVVPIPR